MYYHHRSYRNMVKRHDYLLSVRRSCECWHRQQSSHPISMDQERGVSKWSDAWSEYPRMAERRDRSVVLVSRGRQEGVNLTLSAAAESKQINSPEIRAISKRLPITAATATGNS